MLKGNEKIALFLDGANVYATAKQLGIDVDYGKLLTLFSEKAYLVRALYYSAVLGDEVYSSIRPLLDWLSYNGYTVVSKQAKEFTDENGRKKIKGNMDMELAVDMMMLANSVDRVVLFSGDGDFRYVVEKIQQLGVRVTVVSSLLTPYSMIADELRRQADDFIDWVALKPHVSRTHRNNASPKSMFDV